MSASGQTQPFGILISMSEAEGRPDVTGPKADVAILMSEPEAKADVVSATAHDRV